MSRSEYVMYFFGVLLLLSNFSLLGLCEEEANPNVPDLTSADFDTFISKNDEVLVMFHAPWCGHCKKLTPIFVEAAETVKNMNMTDIKATFARVDATAHKDLGERYNIEGYPTVLFFTKSSKEPEKYSGDRSVAGFINFLTVMGGPPVRIVKGEEIKARKSEKKPTGGNVIFVGSFKSEDSDVYKIFEEFARGNRKYGKFVAEIGGEATGRVWVEKEDKNVDYEGEITVDGLKKFLRVEAYPLYGHISGENFARYEERGYDFAWFCGTPEQYESFKEPVTKAASLFKTTHSFVWLDTKTYGRHAESALGVSKFPSLCIQKKPNGRYVLSDEESLKDADKIKKFVDEVEAGKIKPHLRSEPIPEKNDGPVKIVVGEQFEEMVLRPDQDVMLEVYASWCGHCKQLKDIYDKLGETVGNWTDSHKVVIAKLEGSLNESPLSAFKWEAFPTIFYVRANTTEPLLFSGERTVEGFIKFIKENTKLDINTTMVGTDKTKPADEKAAADDKKREEL